mmetsp:Transcript_2335/g.5939  ORF Transcript_2335/g.5939 Transcript_2335/m.5939 type:complete len:98 (-) Transcript_2335:278-571(-)
MKQTNGTPLQTGEKLARKSAAHPWRSGLSKYSRLNQRYSAGSKWLGGSAAPGWRRTEMRRDDQEARKSPLDSRAGTEELGVPLAQHCETAGVGERGA